MSGNQAIFDHVTGLARAWRFEHGTREVETASRMRSHLFSTAAHADRGLIERIVRFQSRVGHGWVPTPKGRLQGRGQHPARPSKAWATREGRAQVAISVDLMLMQADCDGVPRPSIRKIQAAIKAPVSCGAVRSALNTLRPAPRLQAARSRLSITARDIVGIVEAECPKGAVCCIVDDDFLRKLYVPSINKNTRKSQRRRLHAALAELRMTRDLGFNVMHHDGFVWVGRSRALPKNLHAWAKSNPLRMIRLSDGLIGGRQGLWASDEGQMARSLVECIVDEPFMDAALAALTGATSQAELDRAEEAATYQCDRVADKTLPGYARNQIRMTADRKRGWIASRQKHQQQSIEGLFEIEERKGFPGLWEAARSMPGIMARVDDPASRRRIDRLAKRMAMIVGERRCDQRFAYETILYRDTPRHLRPASPPSPPAAPEPVIGRPIPVPRPRTPEVVVDDGDPMPAFIRNAEAEAYDAWYSRKIREFGAMEKVRQRHVEWGAELVSRP